MSDARRCPAWLVSAPASGQGKTTVTAALARRYRNEGRKVRVFKTGPDFLDPMILERAALQVALGLGLGAVGSMLWTSAFFSGRIDTTLIQPGVFLPVCVVLTVVTIAACAMPLRRAGAIDPVAALRDE